MEKTCGHIAVLGNATIFAGGKGGFEYSIVQVNDQLLQNVKVSQALVNFLQIAHGTAEQVTLWTIREHKMRRLVAIELQNGKRYVTSWWQRKPAIAMIVATILLAFVIPGLILWAELLFVSLPMYRDYQSLISEKPGAIVLEDS